MYTLHPWHGISIGESNPAVVNAFIEIVPTDTVKFEVDKKSGFLKVDRPNRFATQSPCLYGFIPQTYCAENTAKLAGLTKGDGDPLDICVITEKPILHGGILVQARPIGGIALKDKEEADDKIIAVLLDDAVFGGINDISELSPKILERINHYFLTYKDMPGSEGKRKVEIKRTYGREDAYKVISESQKDYANNRERLIK